MIRSGHEAANLGGAIVNVLDSFCHLQTEFPSPPSPDDAWKDEKAGCLFRKAAGSRDEVGRTINHEKDEDMTR